MHVISSCDSGLSEIISYHFLHKMPPKPVSDHVIFKNFWGGMPPDPPNFSMLLHAGCASHNIVANGSKSYSSIILFVAMPVTENMFGPPSIKHLPTPMHSHMHTRTQISPQ